MTTGQRLIEQGRQRERTSHVWLVEPVSQALEVLRLDGATLPHRPGRDRRGYGARRAVDAIEIDLRIPWACWNYRRRIASMVDFCDPDGLSCRNVIGEKNNADLSSV